MDSRTPPHLAKQPSFFADTSPPPQTETSAPATPLSSKGHRGPHRDGFSVEKCRDVLIRHCSWIPRNYNFKDGVNQVYEVLREYLGDENMDLAIAQLNELIEIPSDWLHEEGAPFQAWKHDYMLRHKDLENSHVPRLRNIIVAPVNPTERLKKWREDHPDRDGPAMSSSLSSQSPSSSTEIQTLTPNFGIGTGARGRDWRLENAIFVSSKAEGTRVLHCPSPQELHKKTWNEEFGRGGRLVQERIISPGDIINDLDSLPQNELPLKRKKSFADLRSMRPFGEISGIQQIPSRSSIPVKISGVLHRSFTSRVLGWRSDRARARKEVMARERCLSPLPLHGRYANKVNAYEVDPMVRALPDPESDIGKSYYNNIPTWPLPPCINIPSPRFARKHGLVPHEMPLSGSITIKLGPTADEMAIDKIFDDASGSQSWSNSICSTGPFTPELFKDSGIDFPRHWGGTGHASSCDDFEVGTLSDLGLLGDGAQSPTKNSLHISERKQLSSPGWTLPSPGSRRFPYIPNFVSRGSLGDWRAVPDFSSMKQAMLSRHPWHSFEWRSTSKCYNSKAVSTTSDQRAGGVFQTYPWRGRIKGRKKPCLESSFFEPITTSTTASLWEQLCTSKATMTDSIIPAPTKTESHIPSSIFTTESPLQKIISAIVAEHPSQEYQNSFVKTSHVATAFTSKGDEPQDFKDTVLDTEDPLIRSSIISAWDSITREDFLDGSLSGRLALKIPRESDTIPSQSMLKLVSLGFNKDQRTGDNKFENDRGPNKVPINGFPNRVVNSLELSPGISLSRIQKGEEPNKASLKYLADYEMGLNHDLPPVSLATTLQDLRIYDPSNEYSFESTSERSLEFQEHLYYDPVRDSLKHSGIHCNPGGMQCYPEVLEHPPRTSSMAASGAPATDSAGSVNHRHKEMERKPSLATRISPQRSSEPGRTSDSSYTSDTSSGIMGNFIPVENMANHALTANSAIQSPVDTNWMKNVEYNPNVHVTLGKVSYGVVNFTDSQENVERNDKRKVKDPAQIRDRLGIKNSIESTGGRDSVDLNGPEALSRYIEYLNMHHTEIIKQPDAPSRSLFQCSNGDVNDITYNRTRVDTEDRKIADSDLDAEIPHFTAEDYHVIGAGNPFDADDVQNDADRTTTFTDFMGEMKTYQASNTRQPRKLTHLKNSHSEGNGLYIVKRPDTVTVNEQNTSRRALQRSGSSPSISTMKLAERRDVAQDSIQPFYNEDNRLNSCSANRGQHANGYLESPIRGRGSSKAIAEQPEAVSEPGWNVFETPPQTPQSKKRARSPMRKLFGETWRTNPSPKDELGTLMKAGLIEKTKNKIKGAIGEIALKADVNLVKPPFRNDQEPASRQSTFRVTLNPAQQAEIYFDVEPLICVAANSFLMEECRNGRMTVDSYRKVTRIWSSKGRAQVIEFRYDLATQHDLIAANREKFRFLGRYTNNPEEVKNVLYEWEVNAREMSIRTFCYSDSTIRRHIQGALKILELLGGHPIQYAAIYEARAKMDKWIEEDQMHMTARPSAGSSVMNVWRGPTEFSNELPF